MWSKLNGREGGKLRWVSRFLFVAVIFLLMAQPTASLSDDALLLYQARVGSRQHVVQPMIAPTLVLELLEGPAVFSKGELMRCRFERGTVEVRGIDDVVTKLKADILVCGKSRFVVMGINISHH